MGHHNASTCPLALAAATDGDWEVASRAAQRLQKLCGFAGSDPSTPWPMISGPGIQKVLLPPDGNCLFGSLALGKLLLESLPHQAPIGHRGVSLTMEERGELGANCRSVFLDKVAQTHANMQMWPDLDLEAALDIGRSWPSLEEYLARMRPPITRRRQWGGFPEAALISHDWKIIIALFAKRSDGKYFLVCEPVKPPGVSLERRICVVWLETHYDLLLVSPDQWAKAQEKTQAPTPKPPRA